MVIPSAKIKKRQVCPRHPCLYSILCHYPASVKARAKISLNLPASALIGCIDPIGKEKFSVANCNSNCGGSCGCGRNGNFTRAGALNSLCRARNFPFYTGACPPAPCNGCGCAPATTAECTFASVNSGCSCGCPCNRSGSQCCGCSCGCSDCVTAQSSNCPCNCHRCSDCATAQASNCSCGCHRCSDDASAQSSDCPCGCSGGTSDPTYGVFSANGPINLTAGEAIPWTVRDATINDFTVSGGAIQINNAGYYHALLNANIPANTEVSTILHLELNGQAIDASRMAVTTSNQASAHNFTGSTVIYAPAGATLRTITQSAATINLTTAQPIFALTLVKL